MGDNVWSFHVNIAVPIETKIDWRGELPEKVFSIKADAIECGEFVELILFLLVKKYGFNKDVLEMIDDGKDYIGLPASQIPADVARAFYNRFEELYFNADTVV